MIILKVFLFAFIGVGVYEVLILFVADNVRKNIFEINGVNNIKLKQSIIQILKNVGFIIFIGTIVISMISGNGIIKSTLYASIMVFIYWKSQRVMAKNRKREVLQDLLNVTECLRVQLSSQISLKVALRNIPEICKNKEFANELREMYLEYELSKFTLQETAKRIQKNFDYSEMQLFFSAINQQIQGTSAIEAMDNLIELLKEEYVVSLEEITKNKVALMSMGVLIIVINLAVLGIYPVIIEVIESAKTMLS